METSLQCTRDDFTDILNTCSASPIAFEWRAVTREKRIN